MANKAFHSLGVDDSLEVLGTARTGLSGEEAARRLESFGFNEITAEKKESPLKLLLSQFMNLLIIILIAASVISAVMGDIIEAVSIIVIVILAGVMGFVQEYQASKAIESLKKMAAPKALALRNGEEIILESRMIVPGDVIILKTGDTIPADSRLIESMNLKLEESVLTGESLGVEKKADAKLAEELDIGDRINLVYSGTSISNGRGRAVVIATGKETEFGKIAKMLQGSSEKKTPLQKNLDSVGSKIGIFALILAVAMSVAGVLMGNPVMEMFIWGVALAVAVIPEALPAVVTISLALGVRRMVRRRALIRKLPAVETLGAVNIICSDKTGTLTEDQMTVRKIYLDGKTVDVSGAGYEPVGEFRINGAPYDTNNGIFRMLAMIGSLCSDAKLRKNGTKWEMIGDPTEGGLIVLAAKAGIDNVELSDINIRDAEFPFTSERKRMTTFNRVGNRIMAFSKGAGEIILEHCSRILTSEGERDLLPADREKLQKKIEELGNSALRVIGLAYKDLAEEITEGSETDMVFTGFAGMIDPPRVEAIQAIKVCEAAGIKPIMITGDHKITAVAIAKEMGILKNGKACAGTEIEKMTDAEFSTAVDQTEVFARISPSHKMKIVETLMSKGNIVAMTGDGVNDAPSLKKSNIGIAMGITGTDVSKEASDMILTDDNFASIVSAVEEGRTIFENIKKYLVYLLGGNMGTVFGIIAAMIAGLPLPLTAVQILFINFVMDGFIAIALSVEGPEPGIMSRKPRDVKEGILNRLALRNISLLGIWIAVLTFGVYYWAVKQGMDEGQAATLFFMSLIFARLFNGFVCRSMEQSIFRVRLFANRILLLSVGATLAMVIAMVNLDVLQKIFGLTSMDAKSWIVTIGAAFSVVLFSEILKIFNRAGVVRAR